MSDELPLAGLRVLEIGHFIAGPFCARLLADLGADVIKVEPRGGDPVRTWGMSIDGNSLWWSVHGRNKRCITLDLRHAQGPDLLLALVAQCDVLVENFKPGQLERWGIGEAAIAAANPDCIVAHISGYGQDGPYAERAAFGVIGEAMGGVRHLSGYPPGETDLPPVRAGISFGDSVTGMYSALGILAALFARGKGRKVGAIDAALTESVFSLMEGALPEYGALGAVRQPTGATLPTTAPSNAYRCRDGQWLLIAANADALFRRLCRLMDRTDMTGDPRFKDNAARVANAAVLDGIIGAWAARHDAAEADALLAAADVPATRIYTIADCAADPQFAAREAVLTIPDPVVGRDMLHPAAVPRFAGISPRAAIRWPGPAVGAHNADVYGGLLGLDAGTQERLQREGVI